MGWDYRADKNGEVEFIVTRWYTDGIQYTEEKLKSLGFTPGPRKEIVLKASGFIPNEPLQVEVISGGER